MFTKEDFIFRKPKTSFCLLLAPVCFIITALMTSAVIPWGGTMNFFGRAVPIQATEYWCSVVIHFRYGVFWCVWHLWLAAGLSDNKFSLLGAVRASSQMISYEVAMGLSIIAVIYAYRHIKSPVYGWAATRFYWLEAERCLLFHG